MTAEDINSKTFDAARKGYDMEQVDDFLEEVAAAVTELSRTNRWLAERLRADTRRSAQTEAQAQQIVEQAQARADAIIAQARDEASRLLLGARAAARQTEQL